MASPTTATSTPTLSIDVTKDLDSLSDLANLVTSQQGAIFTLAAQLAGYAGKPIQSAVGVASAKVSITGSANWKTKNGIGFSLTPTASCAISIGNTSTTFAVAMNIDSTDTTNVAMGPIAGQVYVNIDLDFDIKGSVSGSGTFDGVGVAGKASGSASASVSFCQPVDATLETVQALRTAFSKLVLPLAPDSSIRMAPGSLAKVNFDGALNFELDVTYGLGNYKVSAPDLGLVQQSVEKAWEKLAAPTLTVNAGAKASVSYTHSDHFGLITQKNDVNTATVYLVRSADNETDESVGITVGITATNVSLLLDPTQITTTVQQITGSNSIASAIGNAVAQPVNSLQTGLTSKLNGWISDATGQAGLTISLSQQSGRTALFAFRVDLTGALIAEQSWTALLQGSVGKALQIGGFVLLAGSGIADKLKRSSSIQFQFFNLFQWTDTSDYFSNAYTELANDGTIRVFNDLGQEQNIKTKLALNEIRIHFVGTASEDTKGNPSNAEVDLYIELGENNDPKSANILASVIGMIPANPIVHATQQLMTRYVGSNPKGTLTLVNIIKASAYKKIACSPYVGSTPPALPQEQDQDNWYAFQEVTQALMPILGFVSGLTFSDWMHYNNYCNTNSPDGTPDRRHPGDPNAVPPDYFGTAQGQKMYFLLASAQFMNLCDDLNFLATTTAQVTTPNQWYNLLQFVTNAVNQDLNLDYAKSSAGALLLLCAVGAVLVTATAAQAKDASSLTCTLTLS